VISKIHLIYKFISILPLITCSLGYVVIEKQDSWAAFGATGLLVWSIILSIILTLIGLVLLIHARKSNQPLQALSFATFAASSVMLTALMRLVWMKLG